MSPIASFVYLIDGSIELLRIHLSVDVLYLLDLCVAIGELLDVFAADPPL